MGLERYFATHGTGNHCVWRDPSRAHSVVRHRRPATAPEPRPRHRRSAPGNWRVERASMSSCHVHATEVRSRRSPQRPFDSWWFRSGGGLSPPITPPVHAHPAVAWCPDEDVSVIVKDVSVRILFCRSSPHQVGGRTAHRLPAWARSEHSAWLARQCLPVAGHMPEEDRAKAASPSNPTPPACFLPVGRPISVVSRGQHYIGEQAGRPPRVSRSDYRSPGQPQQPGAQFAGVAPRPMAHRVIIGPRYAVED